VRKLFVMLLLIIMLPLQAMAEDPIGEPEVLPAPSAPTGLIASNVTQDSIDLSWHDNPTEEEVLNYTIYMDGIYLTSQSQTTHTVNDLEPDTEYQFYVSAANVSGEGQASNVINVTTRALNEPPYNLTTTSIDNTSISITWEGFAPSYEIFMGEGGTFGSIIKTSGEAYTITDLQSDQQYSIYVVALYEDGDSEPSSMLNVTTGTLAAPYNLRVINIGSTSVVFNWYGSAPTYEIYFDDEAEGTLIGTTNENTYTITGLETEEQYSIFLVSSYEYGDSEPSSTLNVTTGAMSVPTSVEGIVTASFPYIRMLTPFLIIAFAIGATFLIIERLPEIVGRRRYW